MRLFLFGALIGGVSAFLFVAMISAQAYDEKDRQLKYLQKGLENQAREQSNDY